MRLGLRMKNCEMLSSYRARWSFYCFKWLAVFLFGLALALELPKHSMLQQLMLFLVTFPILMTLTAAGYFGLGAFCARFVHGNQRLKCFGVAR